MVAITVQAQITFNACHPFLEDQDYTVNNIGVDGTGRNIFETTPITGDQPCSGIGVCELRFAWNDVASQWEILADDGSGDFSNPYLLYTNIEASTPNPPSLQLGTWVENSAVTLGSCGGDLSNINATLTGDVQNTLSTSQFSIAEAIKLYPNPMEDQLEIVMNSFEQEVKFSMYNLLGEEVLEVALSGSKAIDVSQMAAGVYFMKITYEGNSFTRKLIKQ